MKEKLANALGTVGIIIYYIASVIISILPFVMIDISFWLRLLFFIIIEIFPFTSIVFWIWGLVCAINGVQDVWAIIYYIVFVVMWIPYFVSAILDFVSAILELFQRKK